MARSTRRTTTPPRTCARKTSSTPPSRYALGLARHSRGWLTMRCGVRVQVNALTELTRFSLVQAAPAIRAELVRLYHRKRDARLRQAATSTLT